MTTLRLIGRDADNRGDDIPAQVHLLRRVEQVGFQSVQIDPQVAEHSERGPDIKHVGGTHRAIAHGVEHRLNRPNILCLPDRSLPGRLPGTEHPVRGDPQPCAVDDRRVGYWEHAGSRGRKHFGAGALTGARRAGRVRHKPGNGLIFEHGWLRMSRRHA